MPDHGTTFWVVGSIILIAVALRAIAACRRLRGWPRGMGPPGWPASRRSMESRPGRARMAGNGSTAGTAITSPCNSPARSTPPVVGGSLTPLPRRGLPRRTRATRDRANLPGIAGLGPRRDSADQGGGAVERGTVGPLPDRLPVRDAVGRPGVPPRLVPLRDDARRDDRARGLRFDANRNKINSDIEKAKTRIGGGLRQPAPGAVGWQPRSIANPGTSLGRQLPLPSAT
jgi:hypothetical protein